MEAQIKEVILQTLQFKLGTELYALADVQHFIGIDIGVYKSQVLLYAFQIGVHREDSPEPLLLGQRKWNDDFSYMLRQSSQLIEAGTEKVIWILPDSQISLIFFKDDNGKVVSQPIPWEESFFLKAPYPLELTIGECINIAAGLKKKNPFGNVIPKPIPGIEIDYDMNSAADSAFVKNKLNNANETLSKTDLSALKKKKPHEPKER